MIFNQNDLEFIKQLVERIDELRFERGISLYQLSQKAMLSENTIKSLFKKKSYPNLFTLKQISEALEITLSDLLNFDNKKIKHTKTEQELIHIFNKLTNESKQALLIVAKNLK